MAFLLTGTQLLHRTTNLVPASSNYTCILWVRLLAFPTAGGPSGVNTYVNFFTSINAGYTAWAGSFTGSPGAGTENQYSISTSDGATTGNSSGYFIPLNIWHPIAYVRQGSNQFFYSDGSLVGSPAVLSLAAQTWTELIIGYDGFSATEFQVEGFREWNSALTVNQIRAELASDTAVVAAFTDCPLVDDLLDISGNNHHFTSVGGPAVISPSPPNFGKPTAITMGTFVRFSNVFYQNPKFLNICQVFTGATLNGGTVFGGRSILRVRFSQVAVASGGVPPNVVTTVSNFNITVEYLNAATFTLTNAITAVDPWVDPQLGLPIYLGVSPLTFSGVTGHRVAVAFQASTLSGGVYDTSGSITLYVDDVVVGTATGLQFADQHPFTPSQTVAVQFGCEQCFDNVWCAPGVSAPTTNANGGVIAPSDTIFVYDFAAGDLDGIYPFFSKNPPLVSLDIFPHMVSDVGGGGGYGGSISTSSGSTAITSGGTFLDSPGVQQFWWRNPFLTTPTPPAPPNHTVIEHVIRRLRRAPHLNNENKRVFYPGFELDFQRGIGTPAADPGENPVFMFRISRDGGRTWSSYMKMTAGELGHYRNRAVLKRLGYARDAVFEVTTSDPNNFVLTNAWLTPDPKPGDF